MTVSFNIPFPPPHVNPAEPLIAREKLELILKEWLRNLSTYTSRSDFMEVVRKIFIFYRKETHFQCATGEGVLEITGVQAKSFPDIFSYSPFRHITHLTLQMGLSELPKSIYQLHQLKKLNLSHNNLNELSEQVSNLSQLVDLNLCFNQLTNIPEKVCQLHRLKKLNLSFNKLTTIPFGLYKLRYLTNINLSYNRLIDLPKSFSQLEYLTHLDLSTNRFSHFPNCLLQMREIQDLNLRGNYLSSLPENMDQWRKLHRLDLSNNRLVDGPESLRKLCDQATVLLDQNNDSETSDEESLYRPLNDVIEAPSASSDKEKIRKRKAEKFVEQCEIARKILKKNPPSIISDELGISYGIFNEAADKPIGVYKPRLQVMRIHNKPNVSESEEEESIPGIPIGSEAFRERLAYALSYELSQLLEQNNIPLTDFGVPPTRIMNLRHKLFGEDHKSGSLQKFRKNTITLDWCNKEKFEKINRNEFFKMAILDLIFLNKDRHSENFLYSEQKNKISLIDHGYCFPEIEGLDSLCFYWKELSFVQETIPKNWINFIFQIDLRKIVDRTVKEIDLHTKNFPGEEMEISGEALLIMLCAIQSLKNFATQHRDSFTINAYLDYILSKYDFHYVAIQDPSLNTTKYIESSDNYYVANSKGEKFHQDSFHYLQNIENPLPGALILKQMCEQYGFENVILHKKKYMRSEFAKQVQKIFKRYEGKREEISVYFIQKNLHEIQEHISSCFSTPIRSFGERLQDQDELYK